MQRRHRILAGALCAGLIATTAGAAALAPKKASQLVTLGASGAACGATTAAAFDARIDADGEIASFAIPAGMVLVLDHLTWSAESSSPGPQRVALEIDGMTAVWLDTAGSEDTLETGRSVELPLIPVSSGHTICIRSLNPMDTLLAPRIHGFLAKDS